MTTRTAPKPSREAVRKYQGKSFRYPVGDNLEFTVEVLDVRNRFGHVDVLVRPYRGTGFAWIQADRLGRQTA